MFVGPFTLGGTPAGSLGLVAPAAVAGVEMHLLFNSPFEGKMGHFYMGLVGSYLGMQLLYLALVVVCGR